MLSSGGQMTSSGTGANGEWRGFGRLPATPAIALLEQRHPDRAGPLDLEVGTTDGPLPVVVA
jgi:hypothetical protein